MDANRVFGPIKSRADSNGCINIKHTANYSVLIEVLVVSVFIISRNPRFNMSESQLKLYNLAFPTFQYAPRACMQ